MSLHFNSDKEQIKALQPTIIGEEQITLRAGVGSDEKEIFRAQVDANTLLPRVGINRTGRRVERIVVPEGGGGTGYTLQPTVTIGAPDLEGGRQALASAIISFGSVIAIVVDDIGDGYSVAPSVTITGGNGSGATAVAYLDSVDYELDINGAIRTSTSIISDTARILNLDIDNFVTPDAAFRGPSLKTYMNNTGILWVDNVIVQKDAYRYYGPNVYQAVNTGQTGDLPPQHVDGIELNGTVQFKHIGFRVDDLNAKYYNQTGDSGLFPRSITPLLGDKSDKIATTEYVLNLATNDVGGRIYVSQQIGDDENDGRSAVNPVRTIKRACQLAWQTPGVKESIIISGGDYVEDNPISIPPDASIVGDNLRLVIIRPANPRKHIFKFGDKNYVIGVTYRDQVDSNGDPVATWDYAMVFDDKQRIVYDYTSNGDYGTDFQVGHQVFGPQRDRVTFQTNTGLSSLVVGLEIQGANTGATGNILAVNFNTTTGVNAYISGTVDVEVTSGSFNAGETFEYDIQTGVDPETSEPIFTTYEFVSTDIKSIRAEGEVVFVDEDVTSALPLTRIDFTQAAIGSTGGFQDPGSQEDNGGIIFYTNPLVGRQNIHDFKEGQEILIEGLQTSNPDLSFLNGKQRIYKVLEDADGRSRRFVIPKKLPSALSSLSGNSNFNPGQFATVKSYSKSVTISLLNSPNKFSMATPVARRFQDASLLIRNNINFISDEVVRKINEDFKKEYFAVYNISGNSFDIYLGGSRFAHTYVSGGTVEFGGNTYNISNFVYDNSVTGVATITTSSIIPSLADDSIVRLEGILLECDEGQKVYPSFNIPVSDAKCRRDVGHFLNAVIRDLEFGSNYNVIEAAKKYITGTRIGLVDAEIIQTVKAFEFAKELATYAMRNWRIGNGTPVDPLYTPQYSSVPRYFDDSVIDDLASPACANVASAINTLSYLFVDVITNEASGTYLDAAYLIAKNRDFIADEALGLTEVQYPALNLLDVDQRKCRRDINYVISSLIRDLVLGGNAGILESAESYFTGTELTGIPSSELTPTIYAFNQVRDLCILAMRNWYTNGGAGPQYTPVVSPIPQFTDNTILVDPAGTPWCGNVESSISSSFGLLTSILNGDIAPGATTPTYGTLLDTSTILTYPDSFIIDSNGVVVTPRSDYDDYPIIEASPYTQNSSVISFLGGSGALIDGSKVKQPNCPFPGLEIDGSATYPNQGKSMVASAFTIVSFGGTGYKVVEDGYTQLVSVFVIFCADGVLCESGGYASITNSATNFGIYALRGVGYRREAYSFDVGTITNVSATPTGRTIFTVDGLGREPLEHYIVKIDGFENVDPEIEYFVESVAGVTVGPPFQAILTLESGSGGGAEFKNIDTQQAVSNDSLVGETIRLHRPSIVNSSSHTWEFAGSGTNYNALPENGGTKVEANEQVSENYGRVYCSGTDELGDFKVGTFARIENRTGNITFTGTVTISEVEFLKLKGGDVVVTGFDASNTLGGANSTDSKLPTQKAVKDYITNNLGPYINKPYSTNAVPRALVELTDSGKINIDQIPALRPFSVYTVDDENERISIEGALAGDIAIQQDTSTSYILNNDNDSLFVSFPVDTSLQFTNGDVFTGSITGGKIQATEYRQGVVFRINITDPGSGYTSPPVITITGGNPQFGNVQAAASCTIANGQVVTVSITEFNGYIGGKGYTTPPTVTFSAPAGTGTQATGTALIESRLYGDIVNNIKILESDTIESSDIPPETINITRVVNTSSFDPNNWVSLSSNQIAASDITSGIISTSRLANNSDASNSFTFLRGDQAYAPVVQSIKGSENRYFAKTLITAGNGANEIQFATNSDVLLGHELIDNVTGIQDNTNITQVVTDQGITTITINNPLTATLPAGTIIEFKRPGSPLTFESTYTQGGFVNSVIVVSGGSGYTDGQYFDQPLTGGTGTGLKSNIVVSSGIVTSVTVTNGGNGYNSDFTITDSPTDIGGGSGMVLAAKLSTVNKNYANTSVDILRVTDATISSEEYGTLGVARFYKSQFNIGTAGNGSVQLKTGSGSGLDADLLDGKEGNFYTNASNLSSGTVPGDRLSGTYNISISGQSGFTLRLISGTSNPTSNPSPNNFSVGIIADTKNNSADGLFDGGSKHLVMTLRNFGSDFDSTGGGVRQLAFTDNDNMWLRGSGSGVTSFGTWAKVWTSLNDGPGTGLDADRLDNKQGTWYQNALNINYGTLSDNRIPGYQESKKFKENIKIASSTGDARYSIYVSGLVLGSSPFLPGQTVNLYNAQAQAVGTILISALTTNIDNDDTANQYTIIKGVLTTGNFIGALTIGTASNRVAFQDFTLVDEGTYTVATLESDGGTANLKLGRKDGTSSTPGVYFNSSQLIANYNAAIVASGGNSTDGSGQLNVIVGNSDGLKINGNKIWNEGNITFNSSNVAGTGVIRDANGDFSARIITASLTGAASLNVLKSGDTMTGSLTLSGSSSNLTVGGTLGVTGATSLSNNLTITGGTFDLVKDGLVATYSPATSGSYTLTEFRSRVNYGSDKGFILVQDDSNQTGGATGEDLRMTIGVHNDFRSSSHSDELWFQGGGRQVYNVGSWDSDLNTIIGTPGVGTYNGGPTHEWRVNNSTVMQLSSGGNLGLGYTNVTSYKLAVNGALYVHTGIEIRDDSDNAGAPLTFRGSSSYRNFRIGNQLVANNFFTIQASTAAGGTTWNGTPALGIDGSNNRVTINTTTTSANGIAYQLNVQGNINFNGTLYQNNQPFVTSRWTLNSSTGHIWRLSNVGINKADPNYTLHVAGSANIEGSSFTGGQNTSVLYANGDKQYLDTYGIVKRNRNFIAENITINNGDNCVSVGPITLNNGYTITINNGGVWNIL